MKFNELNAAEKVIFNAIENEVPLKEVVSELCELFISIDSDLDKKNNLIYKSKLDKFLKLNYLTESVLNSRNTNYMKSDIIYYNKYNIIKAISDTFNTDFALTNNLKTHTKEYAYFAKNIYFMNIEDINNDEILEFFYKIFNVNNYDEFAEILHNKTLYGIYCDYDISKEFNNRFLYFITENDFASYLYKLGLIVVDKNIFSDDNNTRVTNADVILNPNKI